MAKIHISPFPSNISHCPIQAQNPANLGILQQLGIQVEEIEIQSSGDLPKLVGVDIPLLKNLTDGAGIAR